MGEVSHCLMPQQAVCSTWWPRWCLEV